MIYQRVSVCSHTAYKSNLVFRSGTSVTVPTVIFVSNEIWFVVCCYSNDDVDIRIMPRDFFMPYLTVDSNTAGGSVCQKHLSKVASHYYAVQYNVNKNVK